MTKTIRSTQSLQIGRHFKIFNRRNKTLVSRRGLALAPRLKLHKQDYMKAKSIFVNLPVKDLDRTRDFWTKLGFPFNENFSDNRALCLVLNDGLIYSMLMTHEMFSSFTNRRISDGTSTQVLIAIEVDSREQVDRIVQLAVENGATRYRESADHGWMYYDCFADPDGHQWEIMFSDPTQLQP